MPKYRTQRSASFYQLPEDSVEIIFVSDAELLHKVHLNLKTIH